MSDPFPQSMKLAELDSAVSQKWVAWILFSAQEESISTTTTGGHRIDASINGISGLWHFTLKL
jgi:hypothetical protein